MNSTFIPLAFIKGKGNLLNIFDFYSMALAAGLGSALLVIFACWCTFVFFYFKQYSYLKKNIIPLLLEAALGLSLDPQLL